MLYNHNSPDFPNKFSPSHYSGGEMWSHGNPGRCPRIYAFPWPCLRGRTSLRLLLGVRGRRWQSHTLDAAALAETVRNEEPGE